MENAALNFNSVFLQVTIIAIIVRPLKYRCLQYQCVSSDSGDSIFCFIILISIAVIIDD